MDVAQALEILREKFKPDDNLAMTSERQEQIICLEDMDDLLAADIAENDLLAEDPPEENRSGSVTPAPMDEPVELPGPSDGVWELAIMPALESLSDDEDSNMPRL